MEKKIGNVWSSINITCRTVDSIYVHDTAALFDIRIISKSLASHLVAKQYCVAARFQKKIFRVVIKETEFWAAASIQEQLCCKLKGRVGGICCKAFEQKTAFSAAASIRKSPSYIVT